MLPRRGSLRYRALLVVIAVAIAPLVYVWLTDVADATVEQRMRVTLRIAGNRIATLLERGDATADRVETVSRRHAVRIRVLDVEGNALHDVDHESGTWSKRIGSVFFKEDGAPTLADFDASLEPVSLRPAFATAVLTGSAEGCATNREHTLMVCHALRTVTSPSGALRVVFVEQSSRRSIRALYDARYQLLKLTLFGVAFAALLGFWLGRKMVRPIEELRELVLARVDAPLRAQPIALDRADEFGDLADSFDTLLAEITARSRANEAFIADLAHEMKNPVAAIRAVSERLEGAPPDAARTERLARVLNDSSLRLDALVTELLELARAEGGLPDEEREDIDLDALVTGLVDALGADTRWSDIRFDLDVVPARVHGVAGRIESVLRNLLANAASFAAEGGVVQVSVRIDGGMVHLEVTDDGPGIDAADLPRVFERFFTKRPDGSGTGLGLALARAVIEAHGGTIAAASRPGEGSTFTVELPVSPST